MFLTAITALFLGISLFIETSSWWIRANASEGRLGYYISRSNIYLYSARMFSLGFSVILAIQIENNHPIHLVSLSLAVSFYFSSIIQFLLLSVKYFRKKIMKIIILLMFLKKEVFIYENSEEKIRNIDIKLFAYSFFSSLIFAAGVSMPSFLSAMFMDDRLLISNIGQFINAFGTIIIVFFVDQKLFRALDEGRLRVALISYTHARVASSLTMGIILTIMSYMVHDV